MKTLLLNIANSFSGLTKALSLSVNLTDYQVSGGEFSFLQNEVNFKTDFSVLPQEVISKSPIILTIEGKGILSKYVELAVDKVKIRNVIPNIQEQDFHITYTPSGNGTWVSIVRKESVVQILEKYGIPFENVIDLHIGSTHVQFLSVFIDDLPQQLGESALEINDGLVSAVSKSNGDTKSTGKSFLQNVIPFHLHLPMVSAMVTFSKLNIDLKADAFSTNHQEQKSKKVFYSTAKIVLGLLLLVFVMNMVFNQVGKTKLNEKSAEASAHTQLNNQANSLKRETELKKGFIEQLNLSINPQFSFFVDQIGATVPKEIQLKTIEVNPLSKSIRKNHLIDFKKNVIRIQALTSSSTFYNQWTNDLRVLDWIIKIESIEYKINKNKVGEFIIEISF